MPSALHNSTFIKLLTLLSQFSTAGQGLLIKLFAMRGSNMFSNTQVPLSKPLNPHLLYWLIWRLKIICHIINNTAPYKMNEKQNNNYILMKPITALLILPILSTNYRLPLLHELSSLSKDFCCCSLSLRIFTLVCSDSHYTTCRKWI